MHHSIWFNMGMQTIKVHLVASIALNSKMALHRITWRTACILGFNFFGFERKSMNMGHDLL